jgi:hypothetical protein
VGDRDWPRATRKPTPLARRPGLSPHRPADRAASGTNCSVELLEVPQGEYPAVDRNEAVQRLLDPQEPLGALRRLRGRGLPSQQHRGQRGGNGLRQRLAVEGHLAAGVAHPGAEVMAAERGQTLADNQPQPEERKQLRVAEIVIEALRRVEKRILDDVGRVEPAPDPCVKAEVDHPQQAVAIVIK